MMCVVVFIILLLFTMKRQALTLDPQPKKRQRKNGVHMKDLLDHEWNIHAMPRDAYVERIQGAVQWLLESDYVEDKDLLRAYTASMPSIWNNRVIGLKGPTVNHTVCVFNFGASPPTHKTEDLREQIVECFRMYVLGRLMSMARVDVSVGLMMRILPDQGLDQEHRRQDYVNPNEGLGNAMYSGPDFNSKVFSMVVDARQGAVDTFREGLVARGDFIDILMSDRASSKERFAFFTNFEIRTHHTIIPIVGARLHASIMPEKGLGDFIWDPKPSPTNTCMFQCIRYGLQQHRLDKGVPTTSALVNTYRNFVKARTGKAIRRKQLFLGYRMCADKKQTLMGNIATSCSRLEDCFSIRINLYAYDRDTTHNGRAIPCYPVFISSKGYKKQPTMHFLMIGQTSTVYYHVVYIRDPVEALQGYRCRECNLTFATHRHHYRHLMRGHRQNTNGTTKNTFEYGSFQRPLTIWDKLKMCCIPVPKFPLQPGHYVLFKFLVNTGMSAKKDTLGEPLYLRAVTTMRGVDEFVGRGPTMVEDFLAWLDKIQARAAEAWMIKTSNYMKKIPPSRKYLADELRNHGSVLPVLSYDPMQASSLMKYLVNKPDIRVAFHKNRYTSIEIGKRFIFLNLVSYTGSKTADVTKLAGVPKHVVIFPYRALEEGNMEHVVAKNSETRTLFVHHGRHQPWERQTDIDNWVDMYAGMTLRDILNKQVKFEFATLTDYINTFMATLRDWVPDVDLFRGNTTAPALSRLIGYKLAKMTNLYIPSPKEGERINKLFRDNMAGGPSVAYEKRVSDEQVMTYDANSLYPSCMLEDMPTGRGMFEFTETDLTRHGASKTSIREHAWIKRVRQEHFLQCTYHIYADDDSPAAHRRVGPYIVDGICFGCQHVYEFMGEYYHYSTAEKKEATRKKLAALEEEGWVVVVMRESDFMQEDYAQRYIDMATCEMYPPLTRRFMRSSKDAEFVKGLIADASKFQEYMMEELKDVDWMDPSTPKMTKIFGFVECDIETDNPPDPVFSPLFVKKDGKACNPMDGAKNVLLFSPYLAYLIVLGYRLTKVHRFLEFQARPVFKTFVKDAIRLRAESDGARKMVYKLVANSVYGSTFMDKSKFHTTSFTRDPVKMAAFVTGAGYVDASYVAGTDYMRCTRAKDQVRVNAPIHLGLAILGRAKLKMVRFYFFLKQQMPDMRLIYFDTDAFTFSIPKSSVLKKDPRWFDGPGEKTCGKFHLEAMGTHAVVVSKKVMAISNRDGQAATKIAHAGIRREMLPDDPLELFASVVDGEFEYMIEQPINLAKGDMVVSSVVKRTIAASNGPLPTHGSH